MRDVQDERRWPGGVSAPGVDYRDELSDTDFAVFVKLRDLRRQLAEKNGVPAYALFKDEQLAETICRQVRTAEALKGIPGVGEARVAKYGPAFLAILNAAGPPRHRRGTSRSLGQRPKRRANGTPGGKRRKPVTFSVLVPEGRQLVARGVSPGGGIRRIEPRRGDRSIAFGLLPPLGAGLSCSPFSRGSRPATYLPPLCG